MDPLKKDNIIAEITPAGRAGVSAIRVSGPDSKHIVSDFFGAKLCKERHMYYVKSTIDDVMLVYYKSPESYTGEDSCEIFCHGNPSVVDHIIKSMLKSHPLLRMATNGEFTKRAYLNGRMDLIQAEAVLDIINSSNVNMAKQKGRILKGELSDRLLSIKKILVELSSICEADIDFSDEGLNVFDPRKAKSILDGVERDINSIINSASLVKDVSDTMRVVIVGRPNVGKSSLFNKLIEYERAIVHHTPGTTRDYIEEDIVVDGVEVTFIDTAGLREDVTSDIEKEGIKKVSDIKNTATIIIEVSDDDVFVEKSFVVLKVRNKIDIHNVKKLDKDVHYVSTFTGEGIVKLKENIFSLISQNIKTDSQRSNVFSVNTRQINYLNNIKMSIQTLQNGLSDQISADIFSFMLRDSISVINKMLGEEDISEKVLDELFSKFCIGK
jgi:tRNA modification GTPase